MINKLTRLSPNNVSDVPNKIIHQISASTKIQNAIFARKRDILAQNALRKGRELLPRKTLQSLQFKISPNRRRRAKMLNLRKRREILRSNLTLERKLVLIVKFLRMRKRIPIVIGPCLPYHTPQGEKLMQLWYH